MAEWHWFGLAAVGATLLVAPNAEAQGSGTREGAMAEQRARAGDCEGALDLFDRQLRTTVNPELRRDRGMCHEKLGHPYPAIDDYRAYLTARPNAPDADAIRARLEELERQVGVVKPAPPPGPGQRNTGADLDISVSTAGEADVAESAGVSTGGKSLDSVERNEQLDLQADTSPLRRGTGFIFGLVLDPQAYGKSEFGWSETAGMDLRYALTRVSTVLVEFNYDHVNSTGSASALGGPGFVGGYEARIALNPRVNDALLLGALVGYEHLSQGATGLVFSAIQPKGRVGYRHVFGPNFGLEATLDGGIAFLHLAGGVANASADESTSIIGLHVGAVLGF